MLMANRDKATSVEMNRKKIGVFVELIHHFLN